MKSEKKKSKKDTLPKKRRAFALDAKPTDAQQWTPLFVAFRDAFEFALDVAAQLARGFDDDVEAVERVRTFMRARIAGHRSAISVDDVMFTFGLIFAAIGRDLQPIAQAAPPLRLALRFPSATEFQPSIPRHLFAPLS